VVFLSDHGEEFFEHGGFEHGHSLYGEVIRVP
jgi:arylsulfatase A-like enzyme